MKSTRKPLMHIATVRYCFILTLVIALAGCSKNFTEQPPPPPPPVTPGDMPDNFFVNTMLGTEKDIAVIINDPISGTQYFVFGSKNPKGEMDSLTHILVKEPATGGWLMHEFDEELQLDNTTTSTGHTIEYTNHNPGNNTSSIAVYESYSGKLLWSGHNIAMGDYFYPGLSEGKFRLFSPTGNSRNTSSAEAIYLFSAVAGCGLGVAGLSMGPTLPLLWGIYNTLSSCKSAYDAMKNVLDGKPAFGCFAILDHANALSGLGETVKSGGGYGQIAMGAMPGIMNYMAQRSGQSECNDSDSIPLPELPPALSDGDPHLRTIDGFYYDFQSWGEFVAMESIEDDLEVQVRQVQPLPMVFPVTFNTAIAVNTGNEVVSIVSSPFSIYINNVLQDTGKATIPLSGGGYISRTLVKKLPVWVMKTANNDFFIVRKSVSRNMPYLGLSIQLPENRKGKVRGIFGNYDGNKFNDLELRNGQPIDPDFETIHTTFAESWRVQQQQSLLYYAPGQTTQTFTQNGFPASHTQIPPDKKDWAESICKSAGINKEPFLGGCILDVLATDDPDMAASSLWQMELSGSDHLLPVDTSGLILKGSAVYTQNIVRLTQASNGQVAQAFVKNPLPGDFETEFSFRIEAPALGGADGLALVIAKNLPDIELNAAAKLGYTGIPASLAVEFDTWVDGGEQGDHVAIHTNGSGPNNANYQYRKANYYMENAFDDGKIHHAHIRYHNKKIEVYLDQQKVLEYAIDLAQELGLNGSCYIGITASTGVAWQTHEVGYWSWKQL